MTENKNLIGIKILGWIFIVEALGCILKVFTLKSRLLAWEWKHIELPFSYYFAVQSFNVISIPFRLALEIGLLKKKIWARINAIIWAATSWLYSVFFFFTYTCKYTIPYSKSLGNSPVFHYVLFTFSFLWTVFVCYYLNLHKVKQTFIREPTLIELIGDQGNVYKIRFSSKLVVKKCLMKGSSPLLTHVLCLGFLSPKEVCYPLRDV